MASVGAKNGLAGAREHGCKTACAESVRWLSFRLSMPRAPTFWRYLIIYLWELTAVLSSSCALGRSGDLIRFETEKTSYLASVGIAGP
jgi:hypothetical protein